MSSPNPSDPRLLLPEWLRDGDIPASAGVAIDTTSIAASDEPGRIVAVDAVEVVVDPVSRLPATPFSERLSLDTRLDPGQLVSAADLPKWLGGLEPVGGPVVAQSRGQAATTQQTRTVVAIEEPEAYDGIEAPENGVVDVNVNGWIVVGAAVGLLVLVVAALKLYLS